MDVALGPRSGSQLRCAVCHDRAGEAARPCPACGAVLHADCLAELARCPTLGCRGDALDPGRPRRRWRALALGVGLLVLLGGGSGLAYRAAVHGLWPALEAELRPGAGRPALDVEVELEGHLSIPGNQEATVELDGERLVFSTGWRIFCEKADVVPYPGDPERDLLRIACSTRGGRGITRQYYGVTPDDRLALVRLETRDRASAGLVNHRCACVRIGPRPLERTAAGWRAALASSDPIERLEALQWVGGRHEVPGPADEAPCEEGCAERRSDAEAALALRRDPAVFAQVRRLARDPDPWAAESARDALVGLVGDRLDASAPVRAAKREGDPAGALATFDGLLDLALGPELLPLFDAHRLASEVEERGRLRLRLGQTEGAIDDLALSMRLSGDESPRQRLRLGVARLLHGAREEGLHDLRALSGEPEAHGLPPALWIAAVTGEAPPDPPPLGEDGWLGPMWAAARGELPVEALVLRADRWLPTSVSPGWRCTLVRCVAGVLLERLGRPDEALAQYRATASSSRVGSTTHDWASCRLAQHAQPR